MVYVLIVCVFIVIITTLFPFFGNHTARMRNFRHKQAVCNPATTILLDGRWNCGHGRYLLNGDTGAVSRDNEQSFTNPTTATFR